VKQAQSALLFCLVVFILVGAFVFGRIVFLSATAPLREADALAAQPPQRNHWTAEAFAGRSSHSISVPDTPLAARMTADDSSDFDSGNSSIYADDSPLVTFQSVYELLKEQFVDRIPSDTPLAHGAVSAMIASLDDPNSRFLEPAERTAIDNQAQGIFAGTGILFSVKKVTVDGLLERQLTVIDPVVGSPAQQAGVKTGDVITDINGHWVVSFDPFLAQAKVFKSLSNDPVSFNHQVDATEAKIKDGLTLPQAQTMLDTVQTTPLAMTILRDGQPIKITVDGSSSTTVADVSSKTLPDGNGYIQFNAFIDSTSGDFQKAYATVSSDPGIVIDLRNCPGGEIDAALSIAQTLDPNKSLGSIIVRDNHGAADKVLGFKVKSELISYIPGNVAPVTPDTYKGRLVVLVNAGTANTAELFAAFLHDQLGARIVGTSTFGDGLAQTLFPMPDGSGFTLTTGLVKTPNNISFAGVGLTPDERLARTDADGDVALADAEEALTLKPLDTTSSVVSTTGQKS
jgi:carboxyl-terminal processing protease